MANPTHINPANGFSAQTKTFHTLRPAAPIPPLSDHRPLSLTDYAISFILPSSATHRPYIIHASSDSYTGSRLTFFDTIRRANSLARQLHTSFHLSLSKGDVAFILLLPSLHLPVIYLSLLSTESGTGSGMASLEESKRYGSVGRLSANVEAKIVDPDTGEALLPGHKGALCLRGPCIMRGYVGDDKATAESIDAEGWLKTGDLCYIDDEGFLFIVDILKELIKYKAYQVPPAELEHLLQSLPEISDAAVIPYPDEDAGQIPMAFVVRKPGSNITESQIMDTVAQQVAPYKKVRRVAFIDSIPKTTAGKILRKDLVALSLAGTTKAE